MGLPDSLVAKVGRLACRRESRSMHRSPLEQAGAKGGDAVDGGVEGGLVELAVGDRFASRSPLVRDGPASRVARQGVGCRATAGSGLLELEVGGVVAAVGQLEVEAAAGALPGLVGLPDVGVLATDRVVRADRHILRGSRRGWSRSPCWCWCRLPKPVGEIVGDVSEGAARRLRGRGHPDHPHRGQRTGGEHAAGLRNLALGTDHFRA